MASVCASVAGRARWSALVGAFVVVTAAGVLTGAIVVALDGAGWREFWRTALEVFGVMLAPAYAVLIGMARRGNGEAGGRG